MSSAPRDQDDPFGWPEGAGAALAAEGVAPEAARAVAAFEAAHFQWVRLAAKGELPAAILPGLGGEEALDLPLFKGMTAVARIAAGVGRAAAEPTVGLLAEELAVDASRASRIAADLVARGLLRREASQGDGRKSVLALTPEGARLLDGFRREKWRVLARIFAGWSPEEVEAFAGFVRRYAGGVQEAIAAARGRGG